MDGLKQRVVGALVIVSLAVIFLPMIFDRPHEASKKQLISIPIQPELPIITIDKPKKPVYKLVETSEEPKATSKPVSNTVSRSEVNVVTKPAVKSVVKSTAKTQPAPGPVFNQDLLNNVWMVQLGTFGNHENAFKLRDKLRTKGYDGHTTKLKRDGKVLVRVFSGPYADKTKAAAIKKQIDKKFKAEKVTSLVVYFK